MTKVKYFVAYQFVHTHSEFHHVQKTGHGMVELFVDRPIKCFDDVKAMKKCIDDLNGPGWDSIITNWKELES